jgi:hypothetical protein
MKKLVIILIFATCSVIHAMNYRELPFSERLERDVRAGSIIKRPEAIFGNEPVCQEVSEFFKDAGYEGPVYAISDVAAERLPAGVIFEKDQDNQVITLLTHRGIYVDPKKFENLGPVLQNKTARATTWYMRHHIPAKNYILPNLLYYGGGIGGLFAAGDTFRTWHKGIKGRRLLWGLIGSCIGVGINRIGLSLKQGTLNTIISSRWRNKAFSQVKNDKKDSQTRSS